MHHIKNMAILTLLVVAVGFIGWFGYLLVCHIVSFVWDAGTILYSALCAIGSLHPVWSFVVVVSVTTYLCLKYIPKD